MTSEPPDDSAPASASAPDRPTSDQLTPERPTAEPPPTSDRPTSEPRPTEPLLARRGFFRAFGREAVAAIGGVAATAAQLQRNGSAAASQLLGIGGVDDSVADNASGTGPAALTPLRVHTAATGPASAGPLAATGAEAPVDLGLSGLARPLAVMSPLAYVSPLAHVSPLAGAPGEADVTPAGVGYRSPYRLDGTTIVIVDQRALPERIVEIPCRSADEIAAAMRGLRIRGAPVLGQVAAYGLWQAAEAAREPDPEAERGQAAEADPAQVAGTGPEQATAPSPAAQTAAIRDAAEAFRAARPGVAPLRRAVARALAAWQAVGGEYAAPDVVADRLKAEADAIAMEALLGQARLGRTGSAALPRPRAVGGRLRILTIDETGALAGGTVGTAMGVVTTAAAEGRALEVIVAETRPALTGARLAAWELALAGVPYRVVADGAAAGLIAGGDVDVVLVGAEAVAADGAILGAAGTYPLALAAARAGVPFVVCTGTEAIDPDLAGAADLRPESRRLVAGSLAEPDTLSGPAADDAPLVAQPLHDVTPPDLISAFVTDEGLLQAPYGEAFAALVWHA